MSKFADMIGSSPDSQQRERGQEVSPRDMRVGEVGAVTLATFRVEQAINNTYPELFEATPIVEATDEAGNTTLSTRIQPAAGQVMQQTVNYRYNQNGA
ncbi:MAG TPA: hypothetical protein VLH86_04325 [Patescibacteria group bacterium]|nr:hypothetical protein [Patescibacteria group bacterium]